jgi:type IV pilus assembly protein PilC
MATSTAVVKTNQFVWEGTDRKGNKTRGEMMGTTPAVVKAQLRKQGIVPKTVKKKAKPLFGSGGGKIKPMDIAIFTRQLATMTKAGVPLIQAFDIVGDGLEKPAMSTMVTQIKNDIAAGNSMASSIAKHPRHFDDLFCSLIDAGEQSGSLETMLDRVAIYKEKTEALKAKIKKAMTYPIAVISVAVIVTGILLIFVVPEFAKTFQSFGSDLPAFTQWVVALSEFVQAKWWMILAIGIGIFFAFKEAKHRSKKVADGVDRFVLKIPIVGDIIFKSIIARFSRTLATTFAAGVPLVDALNSVAGATGNVVYSDAVIQIRDDVTTGTQLNQAIRATGLFPTMLLQMVSIGEESGALDDMLDKVATHYEAEVDNAVDSLTSLLEPMIMAVLGVLVGGLMVAMYLPIFTLGNVIAG